MSTNELNAKIREYWALQALIEEAQAKAETIKDQLKAHMGDSEELRAGEYKTRPSSPPESMLWPSERPCPRWPSTSPG